MAQCGMNGIVQDSRRQHEDSGPEHSANEPSSPHIELTIGTVDLPNKFLARTCRQMSWHINTSNYLLAHHPNAIALLMSRTLALMCRNTTGVSTPLQHASTETTVINASILRSEYNNVLWWLDIQFCIVAYWHAMICRLPSIGGTRVVT